MDDKKESVFLDDVVGEGVVDVEDVEDEYIECNHCGTSVLLGDSVESYDGELYCRNCVFLCEECSRIYSVDEEYESHCPDCCYICESCGNTLTPKSEQCSDDNITLCGSCYTIYYTRCYACSDIVLSNNARYCESCDACYCEDCYNEDHWECDSDHSDNSDLIYTADYKPQPIFYPPKTPSSKYQLYHGVELEVDYADDIFTMAEELHSLSDSELLFYLKEDGSLTSNGVEIVTHPRTLAEHKKFIWPEILGVCKKHAAKSHDAGCCGLHIHSSREFLEGSRSKYFDHKYYKLVYLYDKHFEQLKKFSRRRSTNYCHKPTMLDFMNQMKDLQFRMDWRIPEGANKRLRAVSKHKTDGKYRAVSLYSNKTIETRLWKGTLRHDSIMAYLEFTDGILRLVRSMSVTKIEKLSWVDLVEEVGKQNENEYMTKYMIERGVI